MKKSRFLTREETQETSKSDLVYFAQLEELVNQIIDEATLNQMMTFDTLAKKAHLSPNTVNRLGNYQTKYPQFRTVAKLANALKWSLAFNKTSEKFKLIKRKQETRTKLKVS